MVIKIMKISQILVGRSIVDNHKYHVHLTFLRYLHNYNPASVYLSIMLQYNVFILRKHNRPLDHPCNQTRDGISKIGLRQFTRRNNKLFYLFLNLECSLFQTRQSTVAF